MATYKQHLAARTNLRSNRYERTAVITPERAEKNAKLPRLGVTQPVQPEQDENSARAENPPQQEANHV